MLIDGLTRAPPVPQQALAALAQLPLAQLESHVDVIKGLLDPAAGLVCVAALKVLARLPAPALQHCVGAIVNLLQAGLSNVSRPLEVSEVLSSTEWKVQQFLCALALGQ